MPREHLRVGAPQEFDGVDVLAAAVAVRNPAAGRAAVVEIDHRGDRIDAQPVDAVALHPEQRVGHEEVRHLDAAVVVDQRAPVEMAALHRVGVLVKRGAVEPPKPVRIVGEMPGHPVEQYAEALAVAGVDQRREIFRRAEAAGRREQPGRLVAPRAVERMLGDRHQLDVGEAHVGGIVRQLFRQLAVGQPARAFVGIAPPRAEMHLVDRHRRRQRVGVMLEPRRLRQPCGVDHDRGGRGPLLGRERHRIGLQRQQLPVAADDLVFVFVAGARGRHEDFPDSRCRAPAWRGGGRPRN